MTTNNFLAVATISGSKILPSVVETKGTTIMDALVKLHNLVGPGVSVERTEIKRIEFLNGGFRVTSSVKGRTLRKYTADRGTFVGRLHLTVS